MGSLLHGFLSGSIRFQSAVHKNLYHKIDLSPNPVFQRWRAYLKSWSNFPSLSLNKSERTAHCCKKLYNNKTLYKRFCFLLCKTTSGERENISHKRKNVHQTKPADACKLNKGEFRSPRTANPSQTKVCFPLIKGQNPLNQIYPHKSYSKHMFVFVILFYHIKIQKSIVRCTRSCTPEIFLKDFYLFFS